MCGCNSVLLDEGDLADRFDAEVVTDGEPDHRLWFNIVLGEQLEVITNEVSETIDHFRWGLVPAWTDDPNQGMISARTETDGEKRFFCEA